MIPDYKPLAITLAAAVSIVMLVMTDGEHGIGWFIFALIIIC